MLKASDKKELTDRVSAVSTLLKEKQETGDMMHRSDYAQLDTRLMLLHNATTQMGEGADSVRERVVTLWQRNKAYSNARVKMSVAEHREYNMNLMLIQMEINDIWVG